MISQPPSPQDASGSRQVDWTPLVGALDVVHPGTGAPLAAALSLGARPFEVIAGVPAGRHGARVTFLAHPALAEVGLGDHPWGAPDWIGLRFQAGQLAWKGYHRASRVPACYTLPPEAPADLYPVMAALDGDGEIEVYMRAAAERPYGRFAVACLAPLGLDVRVDVGRDLGLGVAGGRHVDCESLGISPRPLPRPHAHCVSFRYAGTHLRAVTLYADHRSLPDEDTVRREFSSGLDDEERRAYEITLAAVCALGRRADRSYHAMLAWTFAADHSRRRAASLRVPAPLHAPALLSHPWAPGTNGRWPMARGLHR